ncbi:phosphotransferase enzyme family-domain-containing protein [Cercophora newfieldiana]|uniref:Phosphotransferase enzyme family-domain-containing protein n=1 Tax=Cercophora newfieldiana TaxID=92897 RepID=A0AA39Y4U9_9PEZI|nr:phosphotransferase enzyme family-domain-containing protein [Cercophora newfieldiana]
MMRVSLPVDPGAKTRGEVATLQLIRRKTDVPVPRVIAFDDTARNEIGFEWILMELMPGRPAYYRWRRMSMSAKETLVARIAEFQSQLFRCGGLSFRSIGTLSTSSEVPEPGPIVSSVFFAGPHFHYTVPRGPFTSSHDWLRSHLMIIIKEHTTALSTTDTADREYAEGVLRVTRKLLRLLPKIFPQLIHPAERTILWHDDLSLMNLMVDDTGRITAVIDWECISTMPRWVASQMPEFLRGTHREVKPDRNRYTDVEGSEDSTGDSALEDSLDNEGKTELYWIHLMEYEQTQLRKVFAARMRQLRPEWEVEAQESQLRVDFLEAVTKCGGGFYLKRIEQWVDAVERKEFKVGLSEVLRVGMRKEKDKDKGKDKGKA